MLEMLMSNFQDVLIFAVFLGILIAVHEWGHFITAKKLGIQVDEFAIGFGPTLFKKFYNGTNYMLKLFPLGGYVRMAGDDRSKCSGDPKEFFAKPVSHRALVVFNGPLINFILAYFCFVVVFYFGYLQPEPEIYGLRTGSPAQAVGLQVGDQIIEIDGKKVSYLKEIGKYLDRSTGDSIDVTIWRDGETFEKTVPVDVVSTKNIFGRFEDLRTIGLDTSSNTLGFIKEGSLAEKAGIKVGDTIVTVGNKTISGWMDLQETIENSTEENLLIQVRRDGQILDKTIVFEIPNEEIEGGKTPARIIGVSPAANNDNLVKHRFGVVESFGRAGEEFVEITSMTYNAIYSMVIGTMSAKENFGGPVLIYNIVAASTQYGITYFIFILGVISLNLAIFNLLPIIPLDGGHLFLMAIEKIKGSPLPEKFENIIGNIGFSLIILLALYVFYIDFDRVGLIDSIKSLPGKISQSVSQ